MLYGQGRLERERPDTKSGLGRSSDKYHGVHSSGEVWAESNVDAEVGRNRESCLAQWQQQETFWGIDLYSWIGENHLGRIIMNIRDKEIKR
jgi:hypothetical protein